MGNIKIKKGCPFCGKTSEIEVDEVAYENYVRTSNLLQCFGNRNAFDRELIKTGICFDCQEKTFGVPAPGHESEWGEVLGECDCCGASIYSIKHRVEGDKYRCTSCYCPHKLVDGVLIPEEEE